MRRNARSVVVPAAVSPRCENTGERSKDSMRGQLPKVRPFRRALDEARNVGHHQARRVLQVVIDLEVSSRLLAS